MGSDPQSHLEAQNFMVVDNVKVTPEMWRGIKERLREALLAREPDDDLPLWHQSGVNQKGEPFVQLILGEKVIAQMSTEQARDHAHAILEAAEASEQDAFIYDWVINKVGSGQQQAAGLLQDFRAYRAERTGKKGGPSNPRDWVMPPPKKDGF